LLHASTRSGLARVQHFGIGSSFPRFAILLETCANERTGNINALRRKHPTRGPVPVT
jgi:hypothetical protein